MRAQQYPVRPIKLIVAFPPGGAADIIGRLVAQKLGDALGQQVVVENKPGAASAIGTEAVAKSAPDGYTLLLGTTTGLSANPALHRNLPFDSVKSFTPIGMVAATPLILVAHPSFPASNLKDLIALVVARPGYYAFGSNGTGSVFHFAGEMLNHAAGIKMLHVPYKGETFALTDLMGGQIPLAFLTMPPAAPQIKAGKIKPIAVTSAQRSSLLPDVPTIAESGYPDYQVAAWFILLAPAGTPEPIVRRLHDEVTKMLTMADVKDRLASVGPEPLAGGANEYNETVQREIRRFSEIARSANIQPE